MKQLSILLLFTVLLFGCSTQKEASLASVVPGVALSQSSASTADSTVVSDEAGDEGDSSAFETDSTYDSVISEYLEAARTHYLSALAARDRADSLRSVDEFEAAISDLNELAGFPGIDSVQDFTDLSKSVLDDYEKYIAVIDSLGPQTSIFALREKLIQMSDTAGGSGSFVTRKVISGTTIPLVINDLVQEDIDFLRTRFKSHFETWLTRGSMYFPTVKAIFREEGVPEELAYLSFIESGVNPVAQSWAKAVGMWQFVKGTGKLYGLKTNFWYDERKDFIKASRAAARHFRDLHRDLGDWYLALAAYNSGPGRVYRAMRKSGETDYWKMRKYLPRETRNYVPLYIAATVMGLDPKSYGFEFEQVDPIAFEEVTINDCVDLSVLAKCAGSDVETIKRLNPSILRWCTPPGMDEVTLRVPKGSKTAFEQKYAAIPDDQKRNEVYHKVRRKESLASIARKYGMSASLLADANKISAKKRLSAGTILLIPVPKGTSIASLDMFEDKPSKKASRARAKVENVEGQTGKTKTVYKIRKGDTLAEIAKQFGVRLSDLRVWNDIPYGTKIRAGSSLTIWTPATFAGAKKAGAKKEESLASIASVSPAASAMVSSVAGSVKVKRGDTLKRIASRAGMTIEELKSMNGLVSDVIKPGQRLKVGTAKAATDAGVDQPAGKSDTTKVSKSKTYKVKKGDTLSTIASLFGVTVGNLKQWNKLRGHRIKVGQEIRINS